MSDASPPLTQAEVLPLVRATLEAHREVVLQWAAGMPKTWGHLAGHAVGDVRRHLDRDLADGERRLVWALLWQQLQAAATAAAGELPPG